MYITNLAITKIHVSYCHSVPYTFKSFDKKNTYKAQQTGQPAYLASYLHPYTCVYQTSDPDKKNLELPKIKYLKYKNHAAKAFSHTAPSSWNELPIHVKSATSLNSFRSRLKAHFFSLAYPHKLPIRVCQALFHIAFLTPYFPWTTIIGFSFGR